MGWKVWYGGRYGMVEVNLGVCMRHPQQKGQEVVGASRVGGCVGMSSCSAEVHEMCAREVLQRRSCCNPTTVTPSRALPSVCIASDAGVLYDAMGMHMTACGVACGQAGSMSLLQTVTLVAKFQGGMVKQARGWECLCKCNRNCSVRLTSTRA
eukprot:358645-Chlamydomonas_euryale.AAC.11